MYLNDTQKVSDFTDSHKFEAKKSKFYSFEKSSTFDYENLW